ncbi:MAG: hypothetical protein P1V36_07480 [Planctomycetota bacterium]|nr:hypothetical protein [Planctomycetota bacterium]
MPAAAPEAAPDAASDGGPQTGKAPAWPGVDDDPSLGNEDGSGDWCGTGIGQGSGGSGLGWTGPDADGVWTRRVPKSQVRIDAERWRELKRLRERAAKEKDPVERALLDDEIRRFELDGWRLALGGSSSVQFGVERDGVFYTSQADETLEAFRKRVKQEEARRAARKAKSAGEPKDAPK